MMKHRTIWLALLCAIVACGQPQGHSLQPRDTVIPSSVSIANLTTTTTATLSQLAGNGTQLLQVNNSGTVSETPILPRGYFGDGSDGTCTFDGTSTPACATKNSTTSYTLNRDCYCANETVNGGVTVHENGWRDFANTTLTLNGIFDNSGANGSAGTGTGTAAGGASGVSNSIGGTSQQGAGGAAAAAGGTISASGIGGAGGAGGTGGGAAGTVAYTATGYGFRQIPEAITLMVPAVIIPPAGALSMRPLQGGAGGGGGKNASNDGGGGGGGGGCVMVAAFSWLGTGTGAVTANGGNGGNATSTDSPGGGGGGGAVFVIGPNLSTWTNNGGVIEAVGGAAGTGGVGGAVAGSAGTVVQISG